ncbi:MAG: DUF2330 domain-containing protein [Bacteroidia bacterium]|nr:DUF2330 domain-containing protein [Bacteroidia bacterium]
MKKLILTLTILMGITLQSFAFCGFYVAKADVSLFNKTSQVILARKGSHTVVTMSNDFSGDVKDFAMVVPVPEVLKREQIRVKNPAIFATFDAYSGPRMTEYYDPEVCAVAYKEYYDYDDVSVNEVQTTSMAPSREFKRMDNVKVEARYSVEEYDVVILSATESGSLEKWLIQNGYKIPTGAKEVLEPYIKNGLNFFVVKVDAEKQKFIGSSTNLRPLQIEYNSSRFMLPIRLGMANSSGTQDLVVYALSEKGRIETTNYRTVEIPTDRDIPLFVKNQGLFGKFYADLFERTYERSSKNNVYLEYSWDASLDQPVKCDPCVGPPPIVTDLTEAGASWIYKNGQLDQSSRVFFTRLHVRYDRAHFPQDLVFQETPNTTRFQGRYVVHNPPYSNSFSCSEGQDYLRKLKSRRADEMVELALLTGWNTWQYKDYLTQYDTYLERGALDETNYDAVLQHGGVNLDQSGETPTWLYILFYSLLFLLPFGKWLFRRFQTIRS